jgi:azurin
MKKLTFRLFAAAVAFSPVIGLADHHGETKSEAKKADQEILLECNDQMQFNKKELEIKAGETVKLVLKHTGQLPAIAMGHNFVLLDKGTNLMTWAAGASKPELRENDFIPKEEAAQKAVLAHTKIIGGGEETSVTFSVKDAGEYEFLCSFPGHFALMRGKVIVK